MIIELIDGRSVETENLAFNESSYHIRNTVTGEDVTNQIRRSDKVAVWPAFDVETDNRRLSNERAGGYGPVGKLSESTTGAFVDQILTDPLAAPLDTLNKAINQVFTAPGMIKALVIVAALGALYFVVKKEVKG